MSTPLSNLAPGSESRIKRGKYAGDSGMCTLQQRAAHRSYAYPPDALRYSSHALIRASTRWTTVGNVGSDWTGSWPSRGPFVPFVCMRANTHCYSAILSHLVLHARWTRTVVWNKGGYRTIFPYSQLSGTRWIGEQGWRLDRLWLSMGRLMFVCLCSEAYCSSRAQARWTVQVNTPV